MLSLPGVFLRRPLSVFSIKGSKIGFLYKIVGTATSELSKLKKGSKIDILGPLGESYTAKSGLGKKIPLLVAGGTGIASLHFLAQKIGSSGVIFYGAKKKAEFIPLKLNSLKKWKIQFSTEDGSKGYKGLITDYLEKFLTQNKGKEYVVFSCGPNSMLKKVAQICKSHNIEGYVSLEEMMACGVGNCQGCAVRSGNTYKMVCKDGPVFNVNDIEL
ncbi:MAG: dihydroorotate dehydrogenase electron transfer subunit [Elusimicrobia bacterium]|nr:dihydroorotate dehydrogenase electron transfer subunit [Elusimicrobiota bacterium]